MQIVIGDLINREIEIAERKGIGHPDTMCDELSESISRELGTHYLQEFGQIMHHNVDKALLVGGQSCPEFGGGKITEPMTFIIAGRATRLKKVMIDVVVRETVTKWIREHLRFLDPSLHLEIQSKIRPGSTELVELFDRKETQYIALANDTSFGAGYFPHTSLEEEIIRIADTLNGDACHKMLPWVGEDIKVMGYRQNQDRFFTIAIAMVDRFIKDIQDYSRKIGMVEEYLRHELPLENAHMVINSADNYERNSIYMTVSGTSAEQGDDGQVGRGNRVSGLITPYQPMSLEAVSGKNPVSHVGKIYNYFACDLSRDIVQNGFAAAAQVFLVSQIGKPITEPQGIHVRLSEPGSPIKIIQEYIRSRIPDIALYGSFIKNK